ncbi:MAG: penicillin-binding protein 2 [Bryobacterales bacterium]|nr:penicillin-binding protein 2 [Bryobacterales bacterium]
MREFPRNLEKVFGSGAVFAREDRRGMDFRLSLFQYVVFAVFLFLIAGFWQLQIVQADAYAARANENHIKSLPILAPRGKILDRERRVIVDNRSSFSVVLSREGVQEGALRSIAEGLGVDATELLARLNRFSKRARYEPIIVKEQLNSGEVAFVEAHRRMPNYPDMELIREQRRLYPSTGIAAHLIGYVGEVSERELDTLEFARYSEGDVIGKSGVERTHNDILMGVDGKRQVVVDSMGNHRYRIGEKPAVNGKDLTLTIDLDLQVVAELAMDGKRGAVVALDPRNGEVLALVSRPTYDANGLSGRIRAEDWREIVNNPFNPLLNRSIQAQLAPGSTFKPIIAIAGLEEGVIDENFRVSCNGGATFYGRYFKCHKRGGHGSVNLHTAMAQSCDVYFYTVGNLLGIDKIAKYAEMAGFGSRTGIDLPHEASGTVPSTRWKLENYRQKWYAGETISVAIGQGALTVSPIQLAYAMGGLANGGVWQEPHVVKSDTGKLEPHKANWDPEHIKSVVGGLYAVVNEGGTGIRARIPGIPVCGKTGTAQVASNDLVAATKNPELYKDNAWFFGFAPCDHPEIVVAALFEAGEHGNLAAPIVRDVIKAYFDKKNRGEISQRQPARVQTASRNPAPPLPPVAPAPQVEEVDGRPEAQP